MHRNVVMESMLAGRAHNNEGFLPFLKPRKFYLLSCRRCLKCIQNVHSDAVTFPGSIGKLSRSIHRPTLLFPSRSFSRVFFRVDSYASPHAYIFSALNSRHYRSVSLSLPAYTFTYISSRTRFFARLHLVARCRALLPARVCDRRRRRLSACRDEVWRTASRFSILVHYRWFRMFPRAENDQMCILYFPRPLPPLPPFSLSLSLHYRARQIDTFNLGLLRLGARYRA